jgi:hypothetical protein
VGSSPNRQWDEPRAGDPGFDEFVEVAHVHEEWPPAVGVALVQPLLGLDGVD